MVLLLSIMIMVPQSYTIIMKKQQSFQSLPSLLLLPSPSPPPNYINNFIDNMSECNQYHEIAQHVGIKKISAQKLFYQDRPKKCARQSSEKHFHHREDLVHKSMYRRIISNLYCDVIEMQFVNLKVRVVELVGNEQGQ